MNISLKKAKKDEFDAPDPILPYQIDNSQIIKELFHHNQKIFPSSITPTKNTADSNDQSKQKKDSSNIISHRWNPNEIASNQKEMKMQYEFSTPAEKKNQHLMFTQSVTK